MNCHPEPPKTEVLFELRFFCAKKRFKCNHFHFKIVIEVKGLSKGVMK